jgi:excisionase family DNA binding protein
MKEISVREAVTTTGYTRQQVYNLIVNGRILARKVGHEYRIDRRSLADYTQRRGGRGRQSAA